MFQETRLDHQGSCSCGAVTARVTGLVVAMTECWCSDCQKETGGSPTHSAILADEDIHVSSSNIGRFERTSDGGRLVTRLFCPQCGNTIAEQPDDSPYMGLRVGVLADQSFFRPQLILFARSAPDWAKFPDNTNIFETQPESATR